MNKAKAQQVATWIFGSISFAFLVAVFWIDPRLSPSRTTTLILFTALLSGLFAYFMTGSIRLVSKGSLPRIGKFSVQAGSGAALFIFVFLILSFRLDSSTTDLKEALQDVRGHAGSIERDTSKLLGLVEEKATSEEITQDIARRNEAYSVVVTRWVEEEFAIPGRRKRTVYRPVIEQIHSATRPVVSQADEAEKKYSVRVTKYVLDEEVDSEGRKTTSKKLISRTIVSDSKPSVLTADGTELETAIEKAPTENRGDD